MSDKVKIAIIAAVTVIAVLSIWMYFSPYRTCVRAWTERDGNALTARIACARVAG